MGLPSISIEFKSTGITAIKRGERGVVAMILKDSVSNGVLELTNVNDIPASLSTSNKEQITLAMMGTVNPPKKVVVYVLPETATNYTEAQHYFETKKFDYIVVPEIGEDEVLPFALWVKQLRDTNNYKVKAVLPKCAADHEGIINFATDNIKVAAKTYSAKEYCSRIAGILAGLPLNISATYQVLPEVDDVPHLSKAEYDEAINAGKLVLMVDNNERVKIARSVNSLVTTTMDKGEEFKKIKIVDIMDLIHSDIKITTEDNYIGKVSNSYDNKCLLITAIQGYFDVLESQGLLDRGKNKVSIDFEAQRNFLTSIGTDIFKLNEQEIKEANTKDKVFLLATIKILDAIEDLSLQVLI